MENKYNELERLNKLKESGTITEQEFEIEKTKILNNNKSNSNNNKSLKIIVKVFCILSIIALITTIVIGIINVSYNNKYEQWFEDNPTGEMDKILGIKHDYSVRDSYYDKVKSTRKIALVSIICTDILFLAYCISQFINNIKDNKKKGIIILTTGIIVIILFTVVYIFGLNLL